MSCIIFILHSVLWPVLKLNRVRWSICFSRIYHHIYRRAVLTLATAMRSSYKTGSSAMRPLLLETSSSDGSCDERGRGTATTSSVNVDGGDRQSRVDEQLCVRKRRSDEAIMHPQDDYHSCFAKVGLLYCYSRRRHFRSKFYFSSALSVLTKS